MRHFSTMTNVIPSTLLAIVLGSLCASANAGEAAQRYEVVTRTVKFADLDLTRSAGAAALYSRIQYAAKDVCEPGTNRMLVSRTFTQRCMEQAISHAVADVNAPTLTSYHMVKIGQTVRIAQR